MSVLFLRSESKNFDRNKKNIRYLKNIAAINNTYTNMLTFNVFRLNIIL